MDLPYYIIDVYLSVHRLYKNSCFYETDALDFQKKYFECFKNFI